MSTTSRQTILRLPLAQSILRSWPVRRLREGLRIRRMLAGKFGRQLGGTPVISSADMVGKRVLVPLIESSHYFHLQVLLVAKALQIRGADVKVLACGSALPGCEVINDLTDPIDPCMRCRLNVRHLWPEFALDVEPIDNWLEPSERDARQALARSIAINYPDQYVYRDINIVPMVTESIIRAYHGGESPNEVELRNVRSKYLEAAMIGVDVAHRVSSDWMPDVVFSHMNVYADWAPYHILQRQQCKRSSTISMNPFNFNSVVLDMLELYDSPARYERWRAERPQGGLNEVERKSLATFVDERSSGNARTFKEIKMFFRQSEDLPFSIDREKRNIFLFSNVFWDVGIAESGRLFDDVVGWVIQTIKLIADNSECHLYIKPHPAEVFDSTKSRKGVASYIADHFTQLPSNVTIIHPEWGVKTYDLFPHIDVGVLFNGTLGLEMMLSGIPVVITAKAPYSGLGIAYEPDTLEDYSDALMGYMTVEAPSLPSVEEFAYFYFLKTCIPWNLTEQVYSAGFNAFTFESLADLEPGKNPILDHVCNCIMDPEHTVVEAWPNLTLQNSKALD